MVSFNEIFKDDTKLGKKIKAKDYQINGKYPIIDQGQEQIAGYTNKSEGIITEVPAIIFGDHTRAIKYIDTPFFIGADGVKVLHTKDPNANYKYLYYALNNVYIPNTGYNRHFKWLKQANINYPDVTAQKYVVTVLDGLCDIIKKKKFTLKSLDLLVKARFVEMFGDPVANTKGWPLPLIEDVVANEKNALKAGPFGSALKKEYYVESGYKIYGQEQVISGDPDIGDYYIDEERYRQLENCAVKAGDVLISLVGTYGKLLIMPECFEPGIINPRLMKITFDKGKVNPYYFQHFFQSDSLKKALANNTHGGTMDILNLGIVKKLKMPLPPIELQNEFVSFVAQVDKSKVAIQKSLDETQLLFDSLMQEYFS